MDVKLVGNVPLLDENKENYLLNILHEKSEIMKTDNKMHSEMTSSLKDAEDILKMRHYQQTLSSQESTTGNKEDLRYLAKECLTGKRPVPKMEDSTIKATKAQIERLQTLTQRMAAENKIINQDIVDKMTKKSVYLSRIAEEQKRADKSGEL